MGKNRLCTGKRSVYMMQTVTSMMIMTMSMTHDLRVGKGNEA